MLLSNAAPAKNELLQPVSMLFETYVPGQSLPIPGFSWTNLDEWPPLAALIGQWRQIDGWEMNRECVHIRQMSYAIHRLVPKGSHRLSRLERRVSQTGNLRMHAAMEL